MKTRHAAFAAIALSASLAACAAAISDFTRGYAEGEASALSQYASATLTPEQRGAVAFTLSDFGALNTDTLETHAVPWRLAVAALALRDADENGGSVELARVQPLMTRFGFLYPDSIANWPEGLPQPTRALEAPMGLSVGLVQRGVPNVRLTAANLACASCHAGHSFDANGMPQPDIAYLGVPNTSLDLEAYVQEIYAAFKAVRGDEVRLLQAVRTVFPDTTVAEMRTIDNFVLPRLQTRMDALEAAGDRPLPFVNGAPGLTNGVAALRMQFGLLDTNAYEAARGFTSIPDLGARGFRSALLYDGAYAPRDNRRGQALTANDVTQTHLDDLATVTAFFTVPSMGVHPDRAAAHLDDARAVFAFLREYQAPRFPGRIDARRAARGRTLYAERCASCHGLYDDSLERPTLVSFPNWIGPYDTDPARAAAFDAPTAAAVNASPYGDLMSTQATNQYQAPPLTGLWLTAPYLHNGSVPTIWHLMKPETRPVRFMVGGHRLNYTRLGIDGNTARGGDYMYPTNYRPWSRPVVIDTRAPGLSNRGHTEEFERFNDNQRRDLIEYLKLL
jgi:mono/diheme cytochrome c family protein